MLALLKLELVEVDVMIPSNLTWRLFLAVVILVPLAVGVIPFAGTPLTLNTFVQAKLLVLCIALALALGSWSLTLRSEHTVYLGRALIPLALFSVTVAVTSLAALNSRLAFFGDFEQGVGALVMLLCVLAAFLVSQLARSTQRLHQLTSTVIITGTVVAGIGLLQQILWFDAVMGPYARQLPEWYVQRGYGTIGNPDVYAAYLVLPILLAARRVHYAATTRERFRWGTSMTVLLISCVIAQTRAPLAGLFVGGFAYVVGEWWLSRRDAVDSPTRRGTPATSKVLLATIAVAVVLGVLGIGFFGTAVEFGDRFSLASIRDLGGRIPLWASAVEITRDHLLLGVGPDSFRLGWYPTRTTAHLAYGAGLVITDPHSVPLLIAATMGLLGLVAAVFLLLSGLFTGFKTMRNSRAPERPGDYSGWAYGVIGLSTTLLASMLSSVLLFVLLLGIGVLVAPALRESALFERAAGVRNAVAAMSLLAAVALLVFGVLTGAAQLVAVGTSTGDVQLAATRAARAASLAPWDTRIRDLRYRTMVDSALETVFTGEDGRDAVDTAANSLEEAAVAEPHEYLHPYRSAVLLIGSAPELGPTYAVRGIDAGLDGLDLYPNSLELRTGMATGYLQLERPQQAETLLRDVWAADSQYLSSGVAYAEALLALGEFEQAAATVIMLQNRFSDSERVAELDDQIRAHLRQ